jgi:hypothetical protein
MEPENRTAAYNHHIHEVSSLGQSLAADEIAGTTVRGLDAIQRLQLGKWCDVGGCFRRGKTGGVQRFWRGSPSCSRSPTRSCALFVSLPSLEQGWQR